VVPRGHTLPPVRLPFISHAQQHHTPSTSSPHPSPTCARRELWRQAAGRAIRTKFPKYTVDLEERDDWGPCELSVTYVNGKTLVLPAQHLTLLDMFDAMAEGMEELVEKEEQDELEKG
jgi:hypothetical protein